MVSSEAKARFVERYPEVMKFRHGKPRGVECRLLFALALIQQGKTVKEMFAHGGRRIFDVELPAGKFSRTPYVIRVLTDRDKTWVITVLPPQFRDDMRLQVKDMHAKVKHRELRRIVDEETIEPEESADPVTLPPSVKLGTSLGDKLLHALQK